MEGQWERRHLGACLGFPYTYLFRSNNCIQTQPVAPLTSGNPIGLGGFGSPSRTRWWCAIAGKSLGGGRQSCQAIRIAFPALALRELQEADTVCLSFTSADAPQQSLLAFALCHRKHAWRHLCNTFYRQPSHAPSLYCIALLNRLASTLTFVMAAEGSRASPEVWLLQLTDDGAPDVPSGYIYMPPPTDPAYILRFEIEGTSSICRQGSLWVNIPASGEPFRRGQYRSYE